MKVTFNNLLKNGAISSFEKDVLSAAPIKLSLKEKKGEIIAKAQLAKKFEGISKDTSVKAVKAKKGEIKIKKDKALKNALKKADEHEKTSYKLLETVLKNMVNNKALVKELRK